MLKKSIEIPRGTPCKWYRILGNPMKSQGIPLAKCRKTTEILEGFPLANNMESEEDR
jgi:hypothetical protein